MRARIIFPIFDPGGKAIAVGGRILPPPYGRRRDPTVASRRSTRTQPETSIYSKRRTLYALNWAKDDVIKSDEIIVCEGYTDVIAFFIAGMPRAVATCGTALGEDHFKTMRNFAKRIVLAYDADKAGQSAAASVYQWERQNEVDVFVARPAQGSGPCRTGPARPRSTSSVRRPTPSRSCGFVWTESSRARISRRPKVVGERRNARWRCLAEHPSELVRDQYIMQVAGTLRLEESLLRPHGRRARPQPETANRQ